jgi:ammonia channel protein AmtB
MKSNSSRRASWLCCGSGGSVLLCAVRHGTFNLFTATAAAKGTMAAVVSTLVMGQAALLVWVHVRAVRHGRPSSLSPR